MMNESYVLNDEGKCIDVSTGEVVNIQKIIQLKQKQAELDFQKVQTEILALGGTDKDVKIVKYKGKENECVTIKENYEFGKVFRVDLRDIVGNANLSIYAKGFITTFEPYINFPTNSIVIDLKTPTQEEMQDRLGVKKSKMFQILKELENNDIIKKVKINGQTIIYFNPFLYCCGKYVHQDTYELFKDSIYNPIK